MWILDAVPSGADGRVAGRCSRRSRHGVRQDASTRLKTIENHSIQLAGEGTQLVVEVVDGAELGGEIRDGGINSRPPRL